MFLHVTSAEYKGHYKLLVSFNNGERKLVNLKNELYGEVFEPLKDLHRFQRFVISHNTIEWDTGADLAPEYLYALPPEND